nr:leucine-rich repeat extensin-like protein 3 [Maylandia zebra]
MARAVENPHLKRFNSQSSSDVSSDSKYCFQDVGILPPPKRMRLMTWDLSLPPSPPSSPVNDDNTDQKCISGLPYDVPLPPRPPPSEKKYASLRSLEHERSYLMPLSVLANIPLPPSPPPSPVCAEYMNPKCVSPLPHEVPLPPSPPPVEAFGPCGKNPSSTVWSVGDEEEELMLKLIRLMLHDVPLPPCPPPFEKKYASPHSLKHKRSDLMPLSLLANIPLLPSPPPSPVFAEYSDSRCISPLPHEVPLPPSPPPSPVFSEYSDSRCISPLPHEVPLPPSPPLSPVFSEYGDSRCISPLPHEVPLPPSPPPSPVFSEYSDSRCISPLPHEVPLPPSPPPSPVFSEYTDSRCISPLPHEVPLPPSPPPADALPQSKDTHKVLHPDLKYDRSSLDDEVAFFMCPTEKPPGVTALDVSPRPLYEFPHLSEKRCLNLSTVAFLCLDD